jgi:hypothetical protein
MTPAPPVGFNLTFVCPQGQVFESNWLAIPFVMMTCQVGALATHFSTNVYGKLGLCMIRREGRHFQKSVKNSFLGLGKGEKRETAALSQQQPINSWCWVGGEGYEGLVG